MKAKLIAGLLIGVALLAGCSSNQSTAPATDTQAVSTTPSKAEERIKEATGLTLDLEQLYPSAEERQYAEDIIGTKAPNFTLTNLSGETVQLKDFLGQNVVLELGDSGCSSCQQTQPEIDKFRQAAQDVHVIQAYANNSKADVETFLRKTGTKAHPNFLTGDTGNTVFRDYKAKWTPTTLFINKEGIITFVHIGSASQVHFEQFAKLAF